ncbi:MAG: recombinase family protein [Elusimicrobiota bacterium]
MLQNIEKCKINTVMCTALDRMFRSTKDLLSFIDDYVKKYEIDFICLKERFDTTTAQGRAFMTITGAMAEFERAINSQRSKASARARAERGLWVGGQILGYDLPTEKSQKGILIPNEKEAGVVNACMDIYLSVGSVAETCKVANSQGYRTKEYTGRDGKIHPEKEFTYSAMRNLLANQTYIGKKEINKRRSYLPKEKLPEEERYHIIDGVWQPIVSEDKFLAVQKLIQSNEKTKHNGVDYTLHIKQDGQIVKTLHRHNYIFNCGLIYCDKCGTEMEGCARTGANNTRYYYYRCKNRECRFKIPSDEIETIVKDRIKNPALKDKTLDRIVDLTNRRLQEELPNLKKQQKLLEDELNEIKSLAEGIIRKYLNTISGDGNIFIQEKLGELAKRREQIEQAIETLKLMVEDIQKDMVEKEIVRQALVSFDEVFGEIPPYQQKQLLSIVVGQIRVSEDFLKLGLTDKPENVKISELVKTGITQEAIHQARMFDFIV